MEHQPRVRDLIKLLSCMPQDAPLVVDGYEMGCTWLKTVKVVTIAVDVNKNPDIFGDHEVMSPTERADPTKTGLEVVHLRGRSDLRTHFIWREDGVV